MLKRRSWRWVSRDVNSDNIRVHGRLKKPKFADGEYDGVVDSVTYDANEFEPLFGINVTRGMLCKVYFYAAQGIIK
jgi:hypothetical protein